MTNTKQQLQHLLTLEELTAEGLTELLELAKAVKQTPATYKQALNGKKVALLFEKASTRTRISFEVGVIELGRASHRLERIRHANRTRRVVKRHDTSDESVCRCADDSDVFT